MIVMTHANRSFDETHTSWSEIIAFSDILSKTLNKDVRLFDKFDLASQKVEDSPSSIFIFVTGSIDEAIKSFVNINSNSKIYVVIQDPNWPIDIKLSRDYTLITPFKSLENANIDKVQVSLETTMSNLTIDFDQIKRHIYLPFGNMLHESSYYQDLINQKQDSSGYNVTSDNIYIGSLKADRASQFKEIAHNTDFIGNFNQDKFKDVTGVDDVQKEKFKGRMPVFSYLFVASKYETQILMPDYKMIALDVSYIRQLEVALIGTDIKLIPDENTSLPQAAINTLNFALFKQHDIFTPSIKMALSHYGLMSDYLEDNLKGDV